MSGDDRLREAIEAHQAVTLDIRFCDLAGRWQHISVSTADLSFQQMIDGFMLDGSTITGWSRIEWSDLLLKPDMDTLSVDPFSTQPGLSVIADIYEPDSHAPFEYCPRSVLKRAMQVLEQSRHADAARFSAQAEFFVFDHVEHDVSVGRVHGLTDGYELPGHRSSGYERGNGGHRPSAGYYKAVPPTDAFADLRTEIATTLETLGFTKIRHSHGEAPQLQRFSYAETDPLTAADQLMQLRHVARNTASGYGKTASFMPKPMGDVHGASLHVHQSLYTSRKPLFSGNDYANMSAVSFHYIGGLLDHGEALAAFANPTTNSYARLYGSPPCPTVLGFSAHNRSSAIRIPYAVRAEDKRIELRTADSSCNPYLTFAALLVAGLDGLEHRTDAGEPMDRNLYDLPPEHLQSLSRLPDHLELSLQALEADAAIFTQHDVFSSSLISAWCAMKREEIARVRAQPHPVELELYYSL